MVVGWKLSNSMKANLVCDTLNASFVKRGRPTNLIFHSDQGSQYTSSEFKNLLDDFNITASFSKKGYPYDNAVCESFFKFLKKECTNRKSYAGFDDLKEDLFEYIECFYNIRRLIQLTICFHRLRRKRCINRDRYSVFCVYFFEDYS